MRKTWIRWTLGVWLAGSLLAACGGAAPQQAKPSSGIGTPSTTPNSPSLARPQTVRTVLTHLGFPELAQFDNATLNILGRTTCKGARRLVPVDSNDFVVLVGTMTKSLNGSPLGRRYAPTDGAKVLGAFVGGYCPDVRMPV